ncbi:Ubiquitin carboxyl-terminal hydrolase isozyme L3 [Branchiostoma belcheri]|nr:Ubiquitin carboxyl-terminal hydrolase isozyme L3 [Branchiostoma belcheri]
MEVPCLGEPRPMHVKEPTALIEKSRGSSRCEWFKTYSPFVKELGMPGSWSYTDVFGLDDDLLAMVPQPCVALLLLFPINDKYEVFRKGEEERIKEAGQNITPKLYYMKQTIGNACGTIALLHSIANNQEAIKPEKALKTFLENTASMDPVERAAYLEKDESIKVAHESSALEGQTETPSRDDEINLHFVALVHKEGELYELDGRKPFPINWGKTTPDSFLADAAKVCKEFMNRDPDELHFTIVALAQTG